MDWTTEKIHKSSSDKQVELILVAFKGTEV